MMLELLSRGSLRSYTEGLVGGENRESEEKVESMSP